MPEQRSLRDQVTALRAQFEQTDAERKARAHAPELEAADKFLNSLADRLAEAIANKAAHNQFEEVDFHGNKMLTLTFADPALQNVTVQEAESLSGYARLNEVCARRPAVDMCLGLPSRLRPFLPDDAGAQPFTVVRIFALPYDASEDAAQKTERNGPRQAAAPIQPTAPRRNP